MKIQISEDAATLKSLLFQQKNPLAYCRVQAIYLLKTEMFHSIKHLAAFLSRHCRTVQRWLQLYRQGGLKRLLSFHPPPGRARAIPDWAMARLRKQLKTKEGFRSYKEIQSWLETVCGVRASYKVVHHTVRYRLQAKLKVPRPHSHKQAPHAVSHFQQSLPDQLQQIVGLHREVISQFGRLRYWCEDEVRFRLKTLTSRRITLPGVKPIGTVQWSRQGFYLFGVVEPETGEHFFYEFNGIDATCLEKFLELFSIQYPDDFHVIQVDNAPAHLNRSLILPENVALLFQPAYTPEVNPVERVWESLKFELSWSLFADLDALRTAVYRLLNSLSLSAISSLTGWSFLLDALASVREFLAGTEATVSAV